jgi:hypothetical protein
MGDLRNELLRHILATINYRFEKSIKGSPPNFAEFSLGKESRNPTEIVYHMYEVSYATRVFIEQASLPIEPLERLSFERETQRFTAELIRLDQLLAAKDLDMNYSKRLIQGPFSDILTHIGQIAMLQRLVGNPIAGEDFSKSEIRTGLES